MRILIAPDKFKGTLTSRQACRALARGVRAADGAADLQLCPMADGGEGTLETALDRLGGRPVSMEGTGPLGDPLSARIGRMDDGSTLVESALVIGLQLLDPARHDPLRASSYGLGRLLEDLISGDVGGDLFVGLGGSATVDGGLGAARALGYRLTDGRGALLRGTGADLEALAGIEAPGGGGRPPRPAVMVLADTTIPVTGPRGAAPLFAGQKGADGNAIRKLTEGLENFADVVERELGCRVRGMEGGGAAGGLGAGLAAFLGARILPGAAWMAEALGMPRLLDHADLIVTGEGAFDGDHRGKVCGWLCEQAASRSIPVAVVTGSVSGPPPPGRVRFIIPGGDVGEPELEKAGKSLVCKGFSLD